MTGPVTLGDVAFVVLMFFITVVAIYRSITRGGRR